MKTIKKNLFLTISLILGIVVFVACGNDDIDFSLSTDSITLNFEKGSRAEFQIITEGSWNITKIPSFVEVSKTSGTGNATITVVSRERNEGEFPKEDAMTIVVAGASPNALTIKVTQEVMVGCYAEPTNVLVMCDGFAFNVDCGPATKYFYWRVYKQSTYNNKQRSEILKELTEDANKRVQPSNGDCFSYYKATDDTQYVIVTQSYAENDAVGEFVEFPVTTKSTKSQPRATLYTSAEGENVDENSIYKEDGNYYFCWYAEENAYCDEYYTYAVAGKNKFSSFTWMENENFPKLAFYIRQEIQKNGETHDTSINNLSNGREMLYAKRKNDSWNFLSCSYGVDKYCQVVTWGTNTSGEMSGLMNALYWDDINYSSTQSSIRKKEAYNLEQNDGEGIAEYTPEFEMKQIKITRIK